MTATLAIPAVERHESAFEAQKANSAQPALLWTADERQLRRALLRHGLLILATLGFHAPSARRDLRKRICSAVQIDGKPLVILRRTRKSMLSLLAGLALFAALLVALSFGGIAAIHLMSGSDASLLDLAAMPRIWRLLPTVALLYVLGFLHWRTLASLMRRMRLNGLGGQLGGQAPTYAAYYVATTLITLLTLGAAAPWRRIWLTQYMIKRASLGPYRLTFHGAASDLYRRFAISWIGAIGVYLATITGIAWTAGPKILNAAATRRLPSFEPSEAVAIVALTVGASIAVGGLVAWYKFGALRYVAGRTRIDGRLFSLKASMPDYLQAVIGNAAITVISCGFLPHCRGANASLYGQALASCD